MIFLLVIQCVSSTGDCLINTCSKPHLLTVRFLAASVKNLSLPSQTADAFAPSLYLLGRKADRVHQGAASRESNMEVGLIYFISLGYIQYFIYPQTCLIREVTVIDALSSFLIYSSPTCYSMMQSEKYFQKHPACYGSMGWLNIYKYIYILYIYIYKNDGDPHLCCSCGHVAADVQVHSAVILDDAAHTELQLH